MIQHFRFIRAVGICFYSSDPRYSAAPIVLASGEASESWIDCLPSGAWVYAHGGDLCVEGWVFGLSVAGPVSRGAGPEIEIFRQEVCWDGLSGTNWSEGNELLCSYLTLNWLPHFGNTRNMYLTGFYYYLVPFSLKDYDIIFFSCSYIWTSSYTDYLL